MNAVVGAVASAALAALVAVSAYSAGPVLAAAVALVVLATAIGWGALFELPAALGSGVTVGVAGLAGVATALAVQGRARPLAAFAAVLAVGVLAAFAHELVRRPPREDLVESLTGTLAGEVVAVLGATWVLVPQTALRGQAVVVAAAAVAAARLATALPLPALWNGWIGLAAGTAAATLTARFMDVVDVGPGLLIGVSVSGVVVALDRLLASPAELRGAAALMAASAAPVATAGVVAYSVARLFTA